MTLEPAEKDFDRHQLSFNIDYLFYSKHCTWVGKIYDLHNTMFPLLKKAGYN